MKIGAIIQARVGSTRLPAKVLKELPYGSGVTALEQVIRRVKRARSVDKVIVATTLKKEDEALVKIAAKAGVLSFRGSSDNVLERYCFAARKNGLDVVVRITSDCPCIDHVIIDSIVSQHIKSASDYTTNALERSYPHGLDVEVIGANALETAYQRATKTFEKEHVTPYIHMSRPKNFRIKSVKAPSALNDPGIRITLDTEKDYILLCAVFDSLYSQNKWFGAGDIIRLFNEKPWLRFINSDVLQKKIFFSEREEFKEALKLLNIQELYKASSALKKLL